MKQEILNKLENIHEAKTLIEINDLLGLKTADELRELQETLNELVEEYLVFYTKKEKYILLKNCPSLKIGPISINKKGFGFVILPNEEDIYVDASNLNNAIHGDIVLCEVTKNGLKKAKKRELGENGENSGENKTPFPAYFSGTLKILLERTFTPFFCC